MAKIALLRVSQRIFKPCSFLQRPLSSNPMFPDSSLRQFQPKEQPSSSTKGSKSKKQEEEDESFLVKHGGKVATVAFALSAFLLYRFFKQGMDRAKHEEHLHDITLVEPYEANELRLNNNMSKEQFIKVIDRFAPELRREKLKTMPYQDFVDAVSETLPEWKIQSAHLVDRLVRARSIVQRGGECSILFLLVVLSMTIHVAPVDRVQVLFRIALEMEGGYNLGASLISTDTMNLLIEALTDTCQIPNDKRVVLVDDNAMIKEYRTKIPDDFVQEYLEKKKRKQQSQKEENVQKNNGSETSSSLSSKLNYDDFQSMILDDYICAWAECKRGR